MGRAKLLAFLCLITMAISCGTEEIQAVPALQDSGAFPDLGTLPPDSGESGDGAVNDGGTDDDSGTVTDGGSGEDGSVVPDAGDGGAPNDATTTDADTTDGGTTNDGSTIDANTSTTSDGGPTADGGTVDTGPVDSGGVVDAGNPTLNDSDCDGLSDDEERTLGTDPQDPDSDHDGIVDGIELGRTTALAGCLGFPGDADPSSTTDPLDPDSDGDLLNDGIEDRNGDGQRQPDELDPTTTDTDGDGIPDQIEDLNRNGVWDPFETNGTVVDTDTDGISDGVEDANHNGQPDPGETNPMFIDTDFDGLNDGQEDTNFNGQVDAGETNPLLYDSDGDGLSDGCEDANANSNLDVGETDPLQSDSDQDGLADGDEDTNHNCAVDPGETDPGSSDTDCDGLSDLVELLTNYVGGTTNPLVLDSDGDGLPDGLEAGITAPVPLSNCTPALDADSGSTTDPTLPDSDGDNRTDGCEDLNSNGRWDAGELNPLASDTDGDGLPDNVEDYNGDCRFAAGETDGSNPDTDGDGIGDGTEVTNGTNPRWRDTDGDGLWDGVEDTNQNGVVDPGETDPNNTDSDGDGIDDGTEDTNHNGTVDAGETNPRDPDTDDDGLTDSQEIALGTDPTNPDSDGDGLDDGTEVGLNTNPLNPDSDGDGITDGDEVLAGTDPNNNNDPDPDESSGINAVCSDGSLKVVNFDEGASGSDFTISTETSFTYTTISVSAAATWASAMDDATNEVAAFVVELPLISGYAATSADQVAGLQARMLAGPAGLTIGSRQSPRNTLSHDGFQTAVSGILAVTSPSMNTANVRNRMLRAVTGLGASSFSGWPNSTGSSGTSWIVAYQLQVRSSNLVVVGAVVDQTTFDDAADNTSILANDLTNGTSLARANVDLDKTCDQFEATSLPIADFIWMADISGSTDDDRGRISDAATMIFNALTNNGVSFRMGVVPHSDNDYDDGSGNGGDLRGGNFTTSLTTFQSRLSNTSGADGCEFGLEAASNAIREALPRSTANNKLRPDATLAVVYITDEYAQEITEGYCSHNPGGSACNTGIGDLYGGGGTAVCLDVPNAAEQACIDAEVAPYLAQIQNENGIAFGQLFDPNPPESCNTGHFHCPQPGSQASNEPGRGYLEVINATGGTFYSPCVDDPGPALQAIVDAVTGAASQFQLSLVPISSTIKVGVTVNGTGTTTIVPRDKTDGFDFDPVSNTIFFRGSTYRPAVGDLVTVSYRVYGTVTPACVPPLVWNPNTQQCECLADCGVGGCGTMELCDRNPAVCACVCAPDCNGACSGATTCDTNSCSCVCAPNCGGTCTGNWTCNMGTCDCDCNNCNGACTGIEVCDTASCTCACPVDCGGCPSGETCNLLACQCEQGSY